MDVAADGEQVLDQADGGLDQAGRVEPADSAGSVAGEVVPVPISAIAAVPQVRVEGINEHHVAALVRAPAKLPPIVLHRSTMRVVDGLHRVRAAQARGETEIEAVLFDGSEAEAFLLAIRLNQGHGLPLTRQDRQAAVTRIIACQPAWSDRRVAASAGVSPKTVAAVRQRSTAETPHLDARVGLDGRIRPVDPAAGRRRVSELLRRTPDASVRELAAAAGVAPTTAAGIRKRLAAGAAPARQRLTARPGTQPEAQPGTQPEAQPGTQPGGEPQEFAEHLARLRLDPSFRSSDTGRLLLRLIGTHAAGVAAIEQAAGAVPEHRRTSVARLARLCARSWLRLAAQMESPAREMT